MLRNSIWLVVVLLSACVANTSQTGRAAPEDKKPAKVDIDITGHYVCAAWNAETGQTINGSVQVTKRAEYYALRYDDGAFGVGIRSGNIFSESYDYRSRLPAGHTPHPPSSYAGPRGGLSGGGLFTIEKGKKGPVLTGRYTGIPGNGKLGRNKWTFVRPLE